MKGKKSSLIVLPEMVVLQPTVINISNPSEKDTEEGTCPDLDCGMYDEGFNLDLAEDVQEKAMPDSALKLGVLRNRLAKVEWGLLCLHPEALFYQDCICYNSQFCREECEFRNKDGK
jgi:hypothetical protein